MAGFGHETKRPRVAIVGQLNTRGGVQGCILALIDGLNRQGIQPDIVWDIEPTWGLLTQEHVQAGFRRIRFAVPTQTLNRLPLSLRYLAKIFNTYPGDRLRTEYDFFFIFYNGFLLSPAVPHLRYLSGPPLLPQLQMVSPGLRGVPFRFFRWWYTAVLRRFMPAYEYHRQNQYVINSQYTAGLFEQAYGVRLPVVYPPVDVSGRSFTAEDLAQRDTVTFFSRVVSYKRPELVIELAARFPHLRGVIMGSVTPHRLRYFVALQTLARTRGRTDLIFLATPSNDRVLAELARTRFYVFPGANEHFGMTTPEAIASGAIPFVHDSGGQREIVNDARLRFTEADFFDKFAALQSLPDDELNEIRIALRTHVQQYDREVFINKMMKWAEPVFRSGQAADPKPSMIGEVAQ